ncbi:hypothetical protein [Candidatus Poriferisocius sp.]|uniref:hypothetical protein n=1 Tax=Candidatus Poriferisocius sp. TaxID=3101276 RepID=UPI003B515C6B
MGTIRAVAKDIGRFLTFRYDLDTPLTRTEKIAIQVVAVASFAVVLTLWLLG